VPPMSAHGGSGVPPAKGPEETPAAPQGVSGADQPGADSRTSVGQAGNKHGATSPAELERAHSKPAGDKHRATSPEELGHAPSMPADSLVAAVSGLKSLSLSNPEVVQRPVCRLSL
jgi:hypothetical protein